MEDEDKTFDLFKLITTLSHRIILQELSKGPKTVMEIYHVLKNDKRLSIKNRESIYKALEKLRKVGIIEKFYDENNKNLFYKLKQQSLVIKINFKSNSFLIS